MWEYRWADRNREGTVCSAVRWIVLDSGNRRDSGRRNSRDGGAVGGRGSRGEKGREKGREIREKGGKALVLGR